MGRLRRLARPREDGARRVVQKVGEFARKEFTVALPAAKRAASHAVQAFFRNSQRNTPKNAESDEEPDLSA